MTKDRKKIQETTVGCLFLFRKKIFKGNRKKNQQETGNEVGLEGEKRETRRINGRQKDLWKDEFSFCTYLEHTVYMFTRVCARGVGIY